MNQKYFSLKKVAHRHYVEELVSFKVENEFIDSMQSSGTML